MRGGWGGGVMVPKPARTVSVYDPSVSGAASPPAEEAPASGGVPPSVRDSVAHASSDPAAAKGIGFDELAELAGDLLRTPITHVTMVDAEHRRYVSSVAGALAGTGLEEDLCRLVVEAGGPLCVSDAPRDPLTRDLGGLSAAGIMAWAAHPLRAADGAVVGAFGVADTTVRSWSPRDLRAIATMAHAFSAELSLRMSLARERSARSESEFRAALLRASHESTIDGVAVVSPEGELISTNVRFLQIWGFPDDVVRSGSDADALSWAAGQVADPEGFLGRVRQLYAEGRPARDQVRLRDGRVLDRYGTPLTGEDGTPYGYAWYFRDISAENSVARSLEASEARHRALVRVLASEVWYASADGRLLSDMPAWRAVTGQTPAQLAGYGWLDGVHPADRARVQEAWATALAERSMYHAEYRILPVDPATGRAPADSGARTRVVEARGVPMLRAGEVAEWVGVFTDVTDLRRAEDLREGLAALAAQAADRTRALQAITAALSSAVTNDDVMAVILELGEHQLAAAASGIAVRDGSHIRYQMLKGYGPAIQAEWRAFSIERDTPVTYVLRTGEALFLSDRDEIVERFPSLRSFVEESGERALARLPLTTPSGTFGVLALGFHTERRFSVEERDFLVALAGQCALALERTQLYDRVRNTALLLQRSLLPEALPATEGISLAAIYQPATADVEVGGDWYDALLLADGRIAVAVGDVLGKGVRAASVMGQVRNALRGLVHADPSPAVVIGRLDAVTRYLGGDEEFVTLVYAVVDPLDGTVIWSSAGHPPLLVLRGDSAQFTDEMISLPLGLGPDERLEGRLQLAPGDALLLFSDGLVESHTRPLLDGLPLLAETVARLGPQHREISGLCDALLDALREDRQDDDVTLLVLRRDPETAVPEGPSAHAVFPGHATSVAAARSFVRSQLSEWGAPEPASEVATLLVSELVTNAVVHAGTDVDVSLDAQASGVRVSVRDGRRATVLPTHRQAGPDDTHGRGLFMVETLAAAWGINDDQHGKVVWFDVQL